MSFATWARRIVVTIGVVVCALPLSSQVRGDEPWGFSPYRVRAWVQLADYPTLNPALFDRIAREVPLMAELVDKSGWRITVEESPHEYRHLISRGIKQIEISDDQKQSADILKGDRIAFVHVDHHLGEYTIQARQFDCQTHLWGPTSTKHTRYPGLIPRLVYETLRATLVPIAKIEKIEGEFVRLRIRAQQIMKKMKDGVPVPNTESPGWIGMDSIFMPVLRMDDKDGNIRIKDGIKIYDWTYLRPVEEVRSEYVESESYLRAEIHGARRAPLAGRTNRSQRKFALVVRPTLEETRLQLLTRDKTPKPIPDKQIFVKYPGEEDARVIGRTDRRGEIVLPVNDEPLHLVYIKSGERRILARLPIVPGFFDEVSADMKDDKVRLRAEGVLAGLEFNFMDLTIRRQVLALRIRSALTKGNHQEARRIYNDKYLALETRDSFKSRMDKAADELLKDLNDQIPEEDRQKKLIVQMFGEMRKLVDQKMAGDLDGQLNREITNVEQGGVYKPTGQNLDTSEIDEDLKEAEQSGTASPTATNPPAN